MKVRSKWRKGFGKKTNLMNEKLLICRKRNWPLKQENVVKKRNLTNERTLKYKVIGSEKNVEVRFTWFYERYKGRRIKKSEKEEDFSLFSSPLLFHSNQVFFLFYTLLKSSFSIFSNLLHFHSSQLYFFFFKRQKEEDLIKVKKKKSWEDWKKRRLEKNEKEDLKRMKKKKIWEEWKKEKLRRIKMKKT